MKKVRFYVTACIVAVVLYGSMASCHKKKGGVDDSGDCKFCRAFNADFQQVDSANVCSESQESAFRSKNASRTVQCH